MSTIEPTTDHQTVRDALEDLQQEIWNSAERSGWHSRPRELPEIIALCHSELSEALEAYRDGMEEQEVAYEYTDTDGSVTGTPGTKYRTHFNAQTDPESGEIVLGKPEGVASELADTVIRILDHCEDSNIPLARVLLEKVLFNKTRSWRHGGRKI